MDFLQKPLALFSNSYLRVQSKNCGKNSFFRFLFRIFSIFERKFFRLLSKSSKSCQNYLLRVQRNSLWLEIFFLKFWIVLDFLQKPLAGFSKFYLRVQIKNCGKKQLFSFSFQNFFDFWAKFFQTFGQIFKKFLKLPSSCPEEQFVAWIFFKVWIVSDFMQKPLAGFSKFYLRVQIKNCGKKQLFSFSFQNFFDFWAKFFQTFGQIFKKFLKLPSSCPEEQFVAWNIF